MEPKRTGVHHVGCNTGEINLTVGHEEAVKFRAYQRKIHVIESDIYYEPGELED